MQRRTPRAAVSRCSAARMRLLAATPPATASVFRPVCSSASMARGTSMPHTASEKAAHRSGMTICSPFCPALWMRFTAEVFRPEKDRSSGLPAQVRPGHGIARRVSALRRACKATPRGVAAEQPCDLVEALPCRVVARAAENAQLRIVLDIDEHGVPAGDDKAPETAAPDPGRPDSWPRYGP